MKILENSQLDTLIEVLKSKNYTVIGPTIKNEVIIYDEITSSKELPIGITDVQSPNTYRIKKNELPTFFNFVVGPQSWKKFLYPARQKLFTADLKNHKMNFLIDNEEQKFAFLGVRACELQAILIQDKIFINGEYQNSNYKNRRENSLIIAVNCTKAESTCFCDSMNSGPEVKSDYDILLTEIFENDKHYFLLEVGSAKGEEIVNQLNLIDAEPIEIEKKQKVISNTKSQIKRNFDTKDLPKILTRNLENPIWENIAKRCLACGNCTMVCPTCFCVTVEDYTDLERTKAERWVRWDSCFTLEHSYIHGGSVRVSVASRYRQWLTHKLSTWVDQFGVYGCVGCGRCITWCPVGIDLTEEATQIKNNTIL